MVGKNRKDWAKKLDDALWAYRRAFKTPMGFSPFQLVYGKSCHLPVEVEHKANWAITELNLDPTLAMELRKQQLAELEEWRVIAYDNAHLYKERIKRLHDLRIVPKEFKVGDKVLLFNSRFKLTGGKLKSKWSGPFQVVDVTEYGVIEIMGEDHKPFKVNRQRLKIYRGNDIKRVSEITLMDPP